MKKLMFLLLILISFGYAKNYEIKDITPSRVYYEALKLESEIDNITRTLNIKPLNYKTNKPIVGNFKPKHVWQLAYMLNVKINMFRVNHKLPRIEEVGIEPVLNVNPNLPYGMLLRLNTEVQILKVFFGIKNEKDQIKFIKHKTPTDVFNKLLTISIKLDYLNGQEITPSAVFAQAMRLYHDVSTVLVRLNITDETFPSVKKKGLKPRDAFNEVMNFIIHIKNLQRNVDIERTNYSSLDKIKITPEDTFILIGMASAEFQTIKAHLGLKHSITPSALFYENKEPTDVEQLINWLTKRIKLIKTLETL